MKGLTGAILIGVMVFAGPAFAEFYKYLDAGGNVRFTDDINQVPRDQRAAAQSYTESQTSEKHAAETPPAVKAEKPAGPAPEASPAAGGAGEDSIEGRRTRLEAIKKDVDAEHQALLQEHDRLTKEKGEQKNREDINAYNKAVEAFNQRAKDFEKKNNDLHEAVERYNALVNEANTKNAAAPKQ